MNHIFKISKEEKWPTLVALLLFVALNTLMVCYHFIPYTKGGDHIGYWSLFTRYYQISGFDVFTYLTVSKWNAYYTEFRHPLLPFLWYPFYLINYWQMQLTGKNMAIIIVAVVMTVISTYSFVFMRRTFREILQLDKFNATLLSAFFFSFAYIMLAIFVPDHFGISLFLLILSFYVIGKHLVYHEKTPAWQTAVLFIFTAGVTLSNGAKIFLSTLFTNGKNIFRCRYILMGIIIPTLFIMAANIWQNQAFIIPHREQGQRILQARMERDSVFKAQVEADQKRKKDIHGTRIKDKGVLSWADLSVSRSQSLIENVFGESLILHKDHLLQDVGTHRPIFVRYQSMLPYILEGIIVALFVAGMWVGRKSKFLWMIGTWVAIDAFIHLGLGFGLNEVYIMTAHWAFIIPIAIGYLFRSLSGRYLSHLRLIIMMLTVFLLFYNGLLIAQYLLQA